MREKFLGAGTDLCSNALHRLWWIAELTSDGDDYELSEDVFIDQTMVNKVFDRWFARYKPAAITVCRELTEEKPWVVEETTTDSTTRTDERATGVTRRERAEEDASADHLRSSRRRVSGSCRRDGRDSERADQARNGVYPRTRRIGKFGVPRRLVTRSSFHRACRE